MLQSCLGKNTAERFTETLSGAQDLDLRLGSFVSFVAITIT